MHFCCGFLSWFNDKKEILVYQPAREDLCRRQKEKGTGPEKTGKI
jgi:hypothetical protein